MINERMYKKKFTIHMPSINLEHIHKRVETKKNINPLILHYKTKLFKVNQMKYLNTLFILIF